MKRTIIVKCFKCGGLLIATSEQKSRTCPYCGTRLNLQRAQVIASAKDSFEASKLLRELKAKRGVNPHA